LLARAAAPFPAFAGARDFEVAFALRVEVAFALLLVLRAELVPDERSAERPDDADVVARFFGVRFCDAVARACAPLPAEREAGACPLEPRLALA
jgi:hypothetical protein